MKKLIMILGQFLWNIQFLLKVKLEVLGALTKQVTTYESSLIERLRTIYFGGVPGSVILLIPSLCINRCYDRGMMLSMGLDEFDIVWGSTRSIRFEIMRDEGKFHNILIRSDHFWVESDGWVYDTTRGFKVKKWLYYILETPIIRSRKNQDWCHEQDLYKRDLAGNIEQDKYALPIIIPLLEPIKKSLNSELAIKELDLFKQFINYDGLCKEMQFDMTIKS